MTDITPIVSVILPTHNRARMLRRALHSVVHQTLRNIEIIVVDDGSTDDSEAVVRSFADARLRYVRHAAKQGAPAARNTGIRLASANLIAFQDSDDEWLCEKLEKQVAWFAQQGRQTGVVYTGFLRVESNQATYYPPAGIKNRSGNILPSLLHGNFVTTQVALVRKECFDKVGLFDENLPRFQDWELFLRIAREYEFACIDEPLALVFYTTVSLSSDRSQQEAALKIILTKHRDVFVHHRKVLLLHHLYLRLGKNRYFLADFLARHAMLKALFKKLFHWN